MKERNWTIGPWCVEVADSNGVVDSDAAYAVTAIDDGSDDWHIAAVWRDCPGANLNAHLIAAAPELYMVLEELHERLERCSQEPISAAEAYDSFYRDNVQDVLAKARGE